MGNSTVVAGDRFEYDEHNPNGIFGQPLETRNDRYSCVYASTSVSPGLQIITRPSLRPECTENKTKVCIKHLESPLSAAISLELQRRRTAEHLTLLLSPLGPLASALAGLGGDRLSERDVPDHRLCRSSILGTPSDGSGDTGSSRLGSADRRRGSERFACRCRS